MIKLCYKKIFYFMTLCFIVNKAYAREVYDLTLSGRIKQADGIGKIPLIFMDCLKERKAKINWIPLSNHKPNFSDISPFIKKILDKPTEFVGRVGIYTDIISGEFQLPENCFIKIAYSMLESSQIPDEWVTILNTHFDAVVVPDEFNHGTFINSGVTIPVFVLPIVVDVENFFKKKRRYFPNKPFVFGNFSQALDHKNLPLLIEAFTKAFKRDPNIKLLIHSRCGHDRSSVKKALIRANNPNVLFGIKTIKDNEYQNLMKSIDSYVSFSRGEGFSISAREALAAGIPVILSNNSGHCTLVNSGFVRGVPPGNQIKASYNHISGECGYMLDTDLTDAIESMCDVYENYAQHAQKACYARSWVKQYSRDALKNKYCNLVLPRKVILGDRNEITDDYLMTDSLKLYTKYCCI